MTRQQERGLVIALSFVVSGVLIYLGFEKGWRISMIPAQYLGYFVAALGGASLAGVNIWFHGDLNPKNDPAPANEYHAGSQRPNPGAR